MVKHLVFLKLKPSAEGASREENARKIKASLEALVGRVPSLKAMEVGIDFLRSEASWDLAIVSEFADRAGMDAYMNHPEHLPIVAFIGRVRESRAAVDYEI